MTLLDVEELTRYWVDHPPLHLMVAAYLGVGKGDRRRVRVRPPTAAPFENGANPAVGALLTELGPSFTGGDVHAGLAPVLLDFADLRRGAQPQARASPGATAAADMAP
ncbi:MAG: hypothetical protein ACREEZ_01805 [Stellaceae bacterium]